MPIFARAKFTTALASSAAFTADQVEALADAIEASFEAAIVPGESHAAPPLRGAGADLS